jgi:HK97 family phage portal protein
MSSPGMWNPMTDVPDYFSSAGGLLLPTKALVESKSKAIQVSSGGYLQFTDASLELYVRQQLAQSRRKFFIFGEMFRRSVWVRSPIEWICNSATGLGDDKLVDPKAPSNPDIEDIEEFLDDCHPQLTYLDLRWMWYQSLKIYGQAYAYIEPDNNGRPKGFWPLDPRVTFPVTDAHGTILFHAQVYNGKMVALMPEEVLYFAVPNNNTEGWALSPLETIYDSVALELNANAYNAALFENDLNLGMVFTAGASADKTVIDENDRVLRDKYTRPENAGRHLILYGDMKLLRDGAAALKDINFAELMHQCRLNGTTALGVPAFLLGVTDGMNRASGQIHERSTYVNTVRPLRQFVNRQFTKQFIRNVWGSRSIIMKEPLASMLAHPEQIEAASKVADMGVSTYNEYRQLLGLETVPHGDYPGMKNTGPRAASYARTRPPSPASATPTSTSPLTSGSTTPKSLQTRPSPSKASSPSRAPPTSLPCLTTYHRKTP